MKRMNRYTGASKLLVLLLCAVLLVGTLPAFSASGAKKAKTGATKANAGAGSITVSLKTDVSELPPNAKVAFTLYKVATADPTDYDGWKFDEAFTSYGKKIKATREQSALQDEVNKLAEFIAKENYTGTKQDISSGSTTFDGLEDGLYVGVLTEAPNGLTANAALYAIPSWNADKTELLHALTPIPKDEYTPEIEYRSLPDKVTVTKTDGVKQISGAKFTLYDGEVPVTDFTRSQFDIRTDNEKLKDVLPEVGQSKELTLKETGVPTGHTGSDAVYKVVISAKETIGWEDDTKVITTAYTITIDGVKSIDVENPPIPGVDRNDDSVTVTKTNGTTQISGATFTLYDGSTEVATYEDSKFEISTADEKLQKFLPEVDKTKTLILKETKAPSGYTKSNKSYKVIIKATASEAWNKEKTKLVTTTTYTIAFEDGKKELEVVNEPTTNTTTPPDDDTPDGGGGVPEPGPTPEPTIEISGTKVWADGGNEYHTRPGSIEITLLADRSPVSATPTWSKNGDRWTFTFTGLPQYSSEGNQIDYTVEETPVENYESSTDHMTITNTLLPPVITYIDISGQKTWNDSDNKSGIRPPTITIRLMRDDEEVDRRTVTAGTDWSYTFQHVPEGDGYGHTYTYKIREEGVPGYYTTYDEANRNVTNSLLGDKVPPPITGNNPPPPGGTPPERPEDIPDRRTGTPVPRFEELGDEELEELFDMFGYGTPLYGMLGTGDQIPIWVWICSGVGVAALVLFLITGRKKKKAK